MRIEISRNVDDFADQRDRHIAKCGFGAAAAAAVAPNRERGRTDRRRSVGRGLVGAAALLISNQPRKLSSFNQ